MIDETVKKIEAAIKQAHSADPTNKADLIRLLEQLKGELRRRDMEKETTRWLAELRKKAYLDIKP